MDDVNGENNGKGNAVIKHQAKICPIRNLFSNPQLDPTIIEFDSEDNEGTDDEKDCDSAFVKKQGNNKDLMEFI